MRFVRLVTGTVWLMGQLVRPNLGFQVAWNPDAFSYNVGTCIIYTLIAVLIWSGVKVRTI
jgi:hypothetical protein